jgi:hypothetical protein
MQCSTRSQLSESSRGSFCGVVVKDILTEIVGRADDQQVPGILRRKKTNRKN